MPFSGEIVDNGLAQAPLRDEVVLPPNVMRRLLVLKSAAEGAGGAAQAAIDYANQAQARLQQALTDACEDMGLHIAAGVQRRVESVDWVSGRVVLGD